VKCAKRNGGKFDLGVFGMETMGNNYFMPFGLQSGHDVSWLMSVLCNL
jgi:hypothetical protein